MSSYYQNFALSAKTRLDINGKTEFCVANFPYSLGVRDGFIQPIFDHIFDKVWPL